jgi:hypothetical protein
MLLCAMLLCAMLAMLLCAMLLAMLLCAMLYAPCACSWDHMVNMAKEDSMSAAVVFLPERTTHFGRHGSDKCYCCEMYGEVKPWGCKVGSIGLL